MLKELITLDQELLLALNGSDSLFMDGLMWTFTQTLTWVPLLVGIIYVLFQNQRPSVCFTIILTAILLVVFTDQFSSSLCKPYFHRLRPTRTPEIAAMVDVVNGYRGGLYGFISSHAANTFGAAMFFTLVFRHAPTGLLGKPLQLHPHLSGCPFPHRYPLWCTLRPCVRHPLLVCVPTHMRSPCHQQRL